jgi:hypothetical protein
MSLAWLLLLTGLTISAVAIYYSVVGLTAIFSAAVIPIIVMGSALEVAKLVCASWLKANWSRIPLLLKTYMSIAVIFLMLLTSMGIFGFLSKAHNDQNLVSGDVQSKIAIYDEKIKTAKENIESDRKQLKQMDEAVDQIMARSTTEGGADKANAVRKSQARDRGALAKDIEANQKIIAALNDESAPIRAEIRKVEAEVGPLKYIAKFIYGDKTDENMLEKAVTWVIILIVVVFDPLAVIMLLAAQMTFAWHNKNHDPLAEEEELLHDTVPLYVADVGEKPTAEELAEIAEGDSPEKNPDIVSASTVTLTADNVTWPEIKQEPESTIDYKIIDEDHEPDYPQEASKETDLDIWNRMIAEAEAEVAKTNAYDTIQDRIARGESYIDQTGEEIPLESTSPNAPGLDASIERPGDYLTESEDSKKKTYMTKDDSGKMQTKNRE